MSGLLFAERWALLLLLLVPTIGVLTIVAWRLRVRTTTKLLARSTHPLLTPGSASWRTARGVLSLLGLAFVIVALARPQYGSRERTLRKRGVDVVICLDFSKSMLAADVRPSRIERAKAEVIRFAQELTGDRVGVVAFAGETMEFPMTTDPATVPLFLRDLGPYDMPVGGTAIGRALVAAKRMLERATRSRDPHSAAEERARVVVLLTDGEDHEGDPVDAARELQQIGARVFTVGIGTRAGEMIPTYAADGTWTGYMRDEQGQPITTALTAAGEDKLREIANVTHGRYFHAERGGVGMDQVRRELRRLRQTELQARRVTVHEERYLWALLPGFLLLAIGGLLPEALPRRRSRSARQPAANGAVPHRKLAGAIVTTSFLLGALAPGAVSAQPNPGNRLAARGWNPFRGPTSSVEEGRARLAANDPQGALAAFDRAARSYPNEPGVHLDRGIALLQMNDLVRARQALELANDPNATPEIRSAALYNLGLTHYRQADTAATGNQHADAQRSFRDAADAFRRAIRSRPGFREAAWNLELANRRLHEEEEKEREERETNQNQNQDEQQNQDPNQQNQNQNENQDQNQSNQNDQNQQQNENQNSDQNQQQPNDARDAGASSPEERDAGTPPPRDAGPPQAPQGEDGGTGANQRPQPQPANQQEQEQAQPAPEQGAPTPLSPEAVRALEALRDSEQNLQRQRAALRAAQERRRPTKDW